MEEGCYVTITYTASSGYDPVNLGIPPNLMAHIENCNLCPAILSANFPGMTLEDFRRKWEEGAPEREARKRFSEACEEFYKTWRGLLYIYFGGPWWSWRARLLGIPKWEDHRPS